MNECCRARPGGYADAAYNLGWAHPGEQLTYNIAVQSFGNYILELRIASPNDTGLVSVLVNNLRLTMIEEPHLARKAVYHLPLVRYL